MSDIEFIVKLRDAFQIAIDAIIAHVINVLKKRVTLINLVNVTTVLEGDRGNQNHNQNYHHSRGKNNRKGSFFYG